MQEVFTLGRREVVVARPFTHPDHIAADTAVLRTMLAAVRQQLAHVPASQFRPPLVTCFPDEAGWQKRVFTVQPRYFREAEGLTAVGFFGQRRQAADPALVTKIRETGEQMLDALMELPGMVSYCSMLLADAFNYANLVLLVSEQSVAVWRQNATHQHVNAFVSPDYYANVRIYNGLLLRGARDRCRLQLHRVKYWDYQETPTWRAVRLLAKDARRPNPDVGLSGG